MATKVSFENFVFDDGSLLFQFDDKTEFAITSLKDGIMNIEPLFGCTLQSMAKNVSGCFEEGSSFYGLKAINFFLNGIHIYVTPRTATPEKIEQMYSEKKNYL